MSAPWIYDHAELDHDVAMLLEEILSDLDVRGVDRATALSAISRAAKAMK